MSTERSARDIVDEIRALNDQRQAELAQLLQPHFQPRYGRRELLQGGGVLGLAALLGGGATAAATEPARAAPSTTDSDGDAGSPSSPVDAWLDGIGAVGSPVEVEERIAMAQALELYSVTKSSSFTLGDEQVVVMDSSTASLTASIPASEERPGRSVVFLDGGDAATNKWTVDPNSGINGQASVDIQYDRAMLVVWWDDDSEWRSNQYVDTLNVRQLSAEDLIINTSLTATGLTLSGTGASPTKWLEHSNTNGAVASTGVAKAISGDNSAVDLIDRLSAGAGMLIVVNGHRQGSAFDGFLDLISYAKSNQFTQFQSETRSPPTGRSYSVSSGVLQLAIDDTGETYDVQAGSLGGNE